MNIRYEITPLEAPRLEDTSINIYYLLAPYELKY